MKKHIIFDFDDTIASSYEHNQQLFVDTFLAHTSNLDQDYIRKVHQVSRGTSMDLQFGEIAKKFKLNIPVKQLVKENELMHQKDAANVEIFRGMEDTLNHLKKLGKILSLCTNRAEGSLKLILKNNNLEQYFDNIVSCKDAGHEKPDPYCLVELEKQYPEIKKDEIIYFGDSETDANFAKNAQIDYLIIDHYLNQKQFYTLAIDSFAGVEDELLVEVDKKNKEIGSIFKMEAFLDVTRFHRSVHVVIFNSRGNVILQKRADTKMYEPGTWDVVGGFVSYGRTSKDMAQFETFEEMGIKANLEFKKVYFRKEHGAFDYLYYAIHDGPYKLDKNEVSDLKEFDCQKLVDMTYEKKYPILKGVYKSIKDLESVWRVLIK